LQSKPIASHTKSRSKSHPTSWEAVAGFPVYRGYAKAYPTNMCQNRVEVGICGEHADEYLFRPHGYRIRGWYGSVSASEKIAITDCGRKRPSCFDFAFFCSNGGVPMVVVCFCSNRGHTVLPLMVVWYSKFASRNGILLHQNLIFPGRGKIQ
jgi:hypothetical protein